MALKDFVRSNTPQFLLNAFRKYKKKKVNAALEQQKQKGDVLTTADLIQTFKAIGIVEGDNLLVHSSLSKIGFVEGGPQAVVDALLQSVGENGNLLMPNSPNASLQLDYIRNLKCFDVVNDKSALGAITEYFRNLPQAIRSLHPTEPVSCIGKDAEYFTKDHQLDNTPYAQNSPWYKLAKRGGKILYIGVSLDNAGTSLHCMEDAVADFKYPVYFKEEFTVDLKDVNGNLSTITTKVHNPEFSALRKCDELLPLFIEKGVAKEVRVGKAKTYLFDAEKMLEHMIYYYEKEGITMYTPKGESLGN
ncbi:aminoglycoside 3-N-acetyltransferase [Lishizhenia tianjinensis]|uniref:Aminoglycoside N(3)-acetyltransferase n=1 Tax=Lishizhenia tianjinensis TaxID=477690 RepID=A0A1I6YME7_9FLAO|nr:AAC(3) family N-acetyltransferase [Lishizhenia tianjinensis]SFT51602.1 aminoglycoside 3-N-acetyltransferase [Lishizhenia tianjinensis]